jgi:hypothetical protein
MSRLLDFYRGAGTDAEGRTLAEILAWGDDDLEAVHDFIQWLFPLPEPSNFNADAPLLTPEDIAAFQGDAVVRANLRRAFARILRFLGLEQQGGGEVVEGPNFAARAPDVWASPNHNWLRVSRILRSLALLGLRPEAGALYARLASFRDSRRFPIREDTFRYWTAAVDGRAPGP